jgi:hypothetical protein
MEERFLKKTDSTHGHADNAHYISERIVVDNKIKYRNILKYKS